MRERGQWIALAQDILHAMREHLDDYCDELGEFVAIDTPSDNPQAVGRLLDVVEPRLRAFGARTQRIAPDILQGVVGGGKGQPILLLCHADTVFGPGEAARRPFRREGDRAYGPGVADMKGGIALLLWVLRLMGERGGSGCEVRVVITGDEETGALRSRDEIAAAARGAQAALVLEPGRESGAIVSERKAVGSFQLTARGIEAHAGVEPWRGASAVHELARRVAAIAELSGRIPDVHFNVGRIEGGTRPNVVAGEAACLIDVRVPRVGDMDQAEAMLAEAATAAADERVSLSLDGGFQGPPMEKTAQTVRFLDYAREAAGEIGLPLEDVATGGGSDGNRVAAAGVPVLDGLGPVGGRAHSEEEFIDLRSVAPRAALLGGIIWRLGGQGRSHMPGG